MINNDKINIVSRKARLSDFLDIDEESYENGNKYNYNNNNDRIQKNQQEFGQKKRIKP